MATGPVLKKKQLGAVQERVPPVGSASPGTIIQPGPYTTGSAGVGVVPNPVTTTPSSAVGSSQYSQYAQAGTPNGVPQSFTDGIASLIAGDTGANNRNAHGNRTFSYNGQAYTVPENGYSQDEFNDIVNRAWNSTTPAQKQEYIQTDAKATAGINQTNLTNAASQAALQAPQNNAKVASNYWTNTVQPAQQRADTAAASQITGDRQAEGEIAGNAKAYGDTLDQNQGLRMAGIQATNAYDTGQAQRYEDATNQANSQLSGYGQQYTNIANQANTQQTGYFNDYRNQLQDINANQSALTSQNASTLNGISANQTGLYNNFMGDVASSNAQQNQNLSQFGGAVRSANSTANQNLAGFGTTVANANSQQNAVLGQYLNELSQMNSEDRGAFLKYLGETDPLMAQKVAQASNPQYVANQEDAVQQFKNNYNPETTDQERFLAELARRKFESDDQGSRQALMQQLAGRGLKSGGLVIAGQQQAQQQIAQDRQASELGLNANAVARAERNRVDFSNASTALRNADDAMKQFSDTYAQNEAVRVGNLAQQRNQQSLNTTGQISARDTAGYNAGTQTVRDNYGRDADYYNASQTVNNQNYGRNLDYYNAGTQTVNDNFARDQAGFNAGTVTNEDNTGRANDIFNNGTTTNNSNTFRDQGILNAGNQLVNDTSNRSTGAVDKNVGITQTQLGNTGSSVGLNIGTNGTNNARYQTGLNQGDLNAGSKLTANNLAPVTHISNLGNEASTAQGAAQVAQNGASTNAQIQSGISADQITGFYRALGLSDADIQKKVAGLG
jgi:hypothetical protein